jgi:hypothetical protein
MVDGALRPLAYLLLVTAASASFGCNICRKGVPVAPNPPEEFEQGSRADDTNLTKLDDLRYPQ